jgi:hypothetical protein
MRQALPSLDCSTGVDHVALSPTNFYYDFEDLDRAVKAGLMAVAAAAHRGRFLEGLRASSTATVQLWVDEINRAAARLAISAFRTLCRQAETVGNWPDVDRWAAKLLELDDLDEEAHALRIRAIAARLGVEAASRLAKDVRSQLVAELGGITNSELRSTCEKYVDADTIGIDAAPSSESPIRGRTDEFRCLSSRWANADSGRHQLVVITGPAGIGKTRLSTHFLRWAAVRGSRILIAKASHSDTHLPYSVVVQLLRSGVRNADIAELARPWKVWLSTLLPEHGVDSSPTGAPEQRELFESVAQLLMSISHRTPLTVFVDDFDHCDPASAWLISFLFQRLSGSRFVLVLASRKTVDAFPHQASAMARSLNEAHVAFLALGPLEQSAAAQIARDRLQVSNVRVESDELEELIERSRGVPFFILQAAEAIASNHKATYQTVDSRVSSYGILSGVRMLSEPSQTLLRALAVLGFRVPRSLVRVTSQLQQAEFNASLAQLLSAGFLRASGQHIEFDHDLTREAVLADLSEEDGRELHRHAAFAISSMACPQAGRLAIHYTAADIPEQAYRAAMTAAAEARRLHAADDAEFYLRLATSKAQTPLDRAIARAALAEHFCELETYHEAQSVLTSWPDVWPHLSSETAELMRVYRMLTDGSCSAETLIAHIEAHWVSRDTFISDGARLRLLREIIGLAYQMGSRLAGDLTSKLIEESSDLPPTVDTAKLIACLARSSAAIEGGTRGLVLADRAVAIAQELGDPGSLAFGLLSRATVHMLQGNLIDAEVDYSACGALVQTPSLLALSVRRTVNRSVLLIETLRPQEAHDTLEEVLPFHLPIEQFFIRGNMALAALEISDMELLMRRIYEMRRINASVALPWVNHFTDCMEAMCLRQGGDLERCYTIAEHLADAERRGGTELLGPDPSYAQALIGHWINLTSHGDALDYLEKSARQYAGRNALGEIRVRLSHAQVLLTCDPGTGRQELRRIAARCKAGGAITLLGHCERLARAAGF